MPVAQDIGAAGTVLGAVTRHFHERIFQAGPLRGKFIERDSMLKGDCPDRRGIQAGDHEFFRNPVGNLGTTGLQLNQHFFRLC